MSSHSRGMPQLQYFQSSDQANTQQISFPPRSIG